MKETDWLLLALIGAGLWWMHKRNTPSAGVPYYLAQPGSSGSSPAPYDSGGISGAPIISAEPIRPPADYVSAPAAGAPEYDPLALVVY